MNELKKARGELKRLRIDMIKFRAEERHRMKKVETIVNHGNITLVEKRELETGNFGEPEVKRTKLESHKKPSPDQWECIGKIESPFLTKCGTPHQPGQLSTKSTIKLSNCKNSSRWMPADALDGLDEYSHCWLLFHFHLNQPNQKGAKSKVAPPRAGGQKVGVFASRAPYRPVPIGLSLVKILKIDQQNGLVEVENCDLVNGTPILDIKPYIPSYDQPDDKDSVKTAAWLNQAKQSTTVTDVAFTARADKQIDELCGAEAAEFRSSLARMLRNDPRSIHRKETDSRDGKDTIFFINFVKFTITAWFDQDHVEVLKVEPFYEHITKD